jgi:hypothetical protein
MPEIVKGGAVQVQDWRKMAPIAGKSNILEGAPGLASGTLRLNIIMHFEVVTATPEQAGNSMEGLFMNADSGFDS